jgi:hypothetical protein
MDQGLPQARLGPNDDTVVSLDRSRKRGVGAAPSAPNWIKDCLRGPKGGLTGSIANVMIAMRFDPTVKDAIAYNQMTLTIVLRGALPTAPNSPGISAPPDLIRARCATPT